MSDLPAPLTYPDLDVRALPYMPLDVVRLRDSDIAALASGDAFRAAVLLWCASWHQVPAASLPNDDANLARYSGYGRDVKGWLKVKEDALRNFVLCSDGRLYHPVIAEKATEADNKREAYRARTRKAAEARRNGNRNDQRNDQNDTDVTTTKVSKGKVSVSKKEDRPKRVRTACSPEFEEFWKAYPRTPNMSKAEAWRAWGRLSSADQIAATAAVPKYRAWLKPDHPVVHACRFLSQRRFDGFNEPEPSNVIPIDPNKFYAAFGSAEMDAWDAYSRKTKGTNMIRDKRGGWLCDARWPPGYEQPKEATNA